MNCTSFREAVHEMDRDGLLDAGAYDRAVAHAQTCTRCARLLYQTRRLDVSLEALSRADERRETPYRVQAQLLRAFRAQAPVRIDAGRTLGWVGAAAAILILAGSALLVWRHIRASSPATRAAQASIIARPLPATPGSRAAGTDVQPESIGPALSPVRGLQTKAHIPKAARTSKSAAQLDEMADLTGFIPLPYADDDTPLGAGELIRVRLSESALGFLGFPVSEETRAQPITADVVIGEDGVARAIRIVSGPVPAELAQLNLTTSNDQGAKP